MATEIIHSLLNLSCIKVCYFKASMLGNIWRDGDCFEQIKPALESYRLNYFPNIVIKLVMEYLN